MLLMHKKILLKGIFLFAIIEEGIMSVFEVGAKQGVEHRTRRFEDVKDDYYANFPTALGEHC